MDWILPEHHPDHLRTVSYDEESIYPQYPHCGLPDSPIGNAWGTGCFASRNARVVLKMKPASTGIKNPAD